MMDKLKALNIGAINVEKKDKGFVQVYNKPVQELGNLNTIGMLTFIMSLPNDWVLRKTHLHKQFTRRTVDNAWKHLVEENYAIDISFYAEGYGKGRIHLYKVSDEKYTDEDIYNYYENVKEAFTESNVIINEDTVEVGNNVDMKGFSFNVQNVQYKYYSTKCTTTKNLKNKEPSNKYINTSLTIVNKESQKSSDEILSDSKAESDKPKITPETILTEACNEYYSTFAVGRLSKRQWDNLINIFVTNTIQRGHYEKIDNLKGYVYTSLKQLANNVDMKRVEAGLFEEYSKVEQPETLDFFMPENMNVPQAKGVRVDKSIDELLEMLEDGWSLNKGEDIND